ncbi:MAG: imidazolonepropionase [Planctomycetota bacterium]|jgi:imidazolonepropionase
MQTVYKNIKQLLQVRPEGIKTLKGANMSVLPKIEHAWLLVEDGIIKDFGEMKSCPKDVENEVNCIGRIILPTWCDSHTHIVFAESREEEFVMKIEGQSYEDIAAAGGGILNSARKLAKLSEEILYKRAAARLEEMMSYGTGAVEIKSGYGLSLEAEIKMLKVIKKLKENYNIPIKANLLAAHAIPLNYKEDREGYIQLIINEIIPLAAKENLAEYIDVFCEKGFFTVDETDRILKAGKKHGLIPKIHANQLAVSGGVQVGVANDALSVDHLEQITEVEINALKATNTMPTALPSCSFFLGIPYTPARKIINADLPMALATDFNPGSTPSGNMQFVLSLACIKMKMTPEEAINAVTINAAYAMGVSETHGSITKGKAASFIITKKISSYAYIPYSFGENCVEEIVY